MSDARVENLKKGLDWLAFGISGATLVQLAHLVLAIPAALYMCFRCYEWLEKRREKRGS